jgi:hypothetical protein
MLENAMNRMKIIPKSLLAMGASRERRLVGHLQSTWRIVL